MATRRSPIRVCFVALNAFGALSGAPTRHSGGVERQQSMIARWFARRGYDTSLVTWDEGQQDAVVLDGVRVLKTCRRDHGLPGLRFLHPRWTGFASALARADADVYHYASADMGLGQLSLWCRWRRRACLYSLSSTWGADARLPHLKPLRERVLYRVGLRRSASVLAQTELQRSMLERGFGIASEVIPMPCEPLGDASPRPHPRGRRVIWVGRFSEEKRLEWLLDVAVLAPDVTFDVVGAPNVDTPYATALIQRASRLQNVTLHGRVADRDRITQLYRESALLCCTSSSEGFPNTFLEAWSLGIPTVSTFDPDGIISSRELGEVVEDVPALARGIESLLASAERYSRASERAAGYFAANHALERVMPRIEAAMQSAHQSTLAASTS